MNINSGSFLFSLIYFNLLSAIVGVNDRLISSALDMPRVPIFDKVFSQTFVNVWDVAAAHLKYEEALAQKPDEVAGQAFLITGPHEAWTLGDVRNAIQVSCN